MIIGEQRSADCRPINRQLICHSFKYNIGRLIGGSAADCQNPKTVGQWKINYTKVVIIYFLSADEKKELKSGILSADHRLINQPTVTGVNVITVLNMLKFKAVAFIPFEQ